jgi:hypothetical protein
VQAAGMDIFAKAIEKLRSEATLADGINILNEGITKRSGLELTEQAKSFGAATVAMAAYAVQTNKR